ncbi:MAG: hypothetical protein V4812_07215 [Pseudomonadota bacterium]
MKDTDWLTIIASEPEYEHLVAELHFKDQFLLLLDREQGRDKLCVAFPDKNGKLTSRIPLDEFIAQLQVSAEDLRQ